MAKPNWIEQKTRENISKIRELEKKQQDLFLENKILSKQNKEYEEIISKFKKELNDFLQEQKNNWKKLEDKIRVDIDYNIMTKINTEDIKKYVDHMIKSQITLWQKQINEYLEKSPPKIAELSKKKFDETLNSVIIKLVKSQGKIFKFGDNEVF